MRFLKVSTYYRDFLADYYTRDPNVVNQSYDDQYSHLMGQCFAWSDNYGRLLSEKGFDTMEIVANAQPLQKKWAEEAGLPVNLSLTDILLKQIELFKPEIIYFQDSVSYNGDFVKRLKEKIPSLKLCIGNICAPFTTVQLESFKVFDYFTVCSPFFQKNLAQYGIESVIIPHAFDQRVLQHLNENNNYQESKLAFIGSIITDEGFHDLRKQVLHQLISNDIPFTFYGNLPDRSKVALVKKQASYLAAKTFDSIGLTGLTDRFPLIKKGRNHSSLPKAPSIAPELYRIALAPVFGLEMFKALSRSMIGFNIHIDCAGDYAANMRLFETTGVGTCLLTDKKSNLSELFKDGEEVITYSSVDDCLDKIKWLLDNPIECRRIARNGQQRTLKDHNFENRVEHFFKELTKRL